MEDDLVLLIEKIIETKLEVGKQVDVISYNETPLKKISSMVSILSRYLSFNGGESGSINFFKMNGAYCVSFSFNTQSIYIITAKQIAKNEKEIVAFTNKALEIRFNYFGSASGIQQNFQNASSR